MKTILVWLCLGLLALAPAPGVHAQQAKPALYRGKPLRHWLKLGIGIDGNAMADTEKALKAACSEPLEAVPQLLEAMHDSDEDVRVGAVRVLKRCEPSSFVALPFLLKALRNDKSPDVRAGAIALVHDFCTRYQSPLPEIARVWATRALLPTFIRTLEQDPEPEVRSSVASHLRVFDPKPRKAIPVLLKALNDKDYETRIQAAYALAEIGDARLVPFLVAAFKNNDETMWTDSFPGRCVHTALASAIGEVGREAVPHLVKALKDDNRLVRAGAARALGRTRPYLKPIYPELRAAVPAIARLLKDRDRFVRLNAAEGLMLIGEEAHAAVPDLCEALEDPDNAVRTSAAFALGRIGPRAAAAVPALVKAFKVEPANRALAACLGKIGPNAKPAVPLLMQLLKHKDASLQWRATDALAKIGPGAKEALPALKEMSKRDDESGRRAIEAIKAINAPPLPTDID